MYNTHYKKLYCPKLHRGATVTNGDLVIVCHKCPITMGYQFGKITRKQFKALPGPLIPIDSPLAPIS